ncbi:MAG: hypothetical protein EOP04_00815 [Proteobacteria bacterium]|nr:MAG: hypothetical protein EOP04_00815 [Pseudomonadota bacterium]
MKMVKVPFEKVGNWRKHPNFDRILWNRWIGAEEFSTSFMKILHFGIFFNMNASLITNAEMLRVVRQRCRFVEQNGLNYLSLFNGANAVDRRELGEVLGCGVGLNFIMQLLCAAGYSSCDIGEIEQEGRGARGDLELIYPGRRPISLEIKGRQNISAASVQEYCEHHLAGYPRPKYVLATRLRYHGQEQVKLFVGDPPSKSKIGSRRDSLIVRLTIQIRLLKSILQFSAAENLQRRVNEIKGSHSYYRYNRVKLDLDSQLLQGRNIKGHSVFVGYSDQNILVGVTKDVVMEIIAQDFDKILARGKKGESFSGKESDVSIMGNGSFLLIIGEWI